VRQVAGAPDQLDAGAVNPLCKLVRIIGCVHLIRIPQMIKVSTAIRWMLFETLVRDRPNNFPGADL
jgi:hypothetical protein